MKRAREDEVGVDGAGPSHRRRADEDSEIVLPVRAMVEPPLPRPQV